MVSQKTIDDFLAQRTFAVVGVSRDPKKFGNMVFATLREKGVTVYPVNPKMETYQGARCYAQLKEVPRPVDAIVTVVPPEQTEAIVRQAAELGITRLWMQQGSESAKAVRYCEQYGISAIHGECIMMYAEPVKSVHKFHKWFLKVLGRLPS